ncbi:uncharacterized protein G2W53_041359 [Senna tora]|uniref:Uncharacterized protein n=1 Tax=Senna tora TaxID=362788 RepID=A0A834VXW1_9FABA|nr:uncharacterized protein G2W53_041359 [Senna tora]
MFLLSRNSSTLCPNFLASASSLFLLQLLRAMEVSVKSIIKSTFVWDRARRQEEGDDKGGVGGW